MSNLEVDYLDEDSITVPGQKYALLCVVSPQSNQKNDICGIKIRGSFATIEDANRQAEIYQKVDKMFDIYVVELYKWLPIPPNNEDIDNHQFAEKRLNDIVKGHKEQQILAKQHFEERKMEAMEDSLKQN